MLAAYGRAVTDGDSAALLEMLDPEAYLEIPSAMRQDVLKVHGREEMGRYVDEIAGEYAELRVDPREFRPLKPGRLLVLGSWRGRAAGGSTPFGTPLALIIEVREGKVTRLRGFMDEQLALEAAESG